MLKTSRRRSSQRPRYLTLPELEQSKTSVLNTLGSPQSRRSYQHAINEFIAWYCSEPRLALNRIVVLRYRLHLETVPLAPATINLRLAAVRRLAYEASDSGLLSPELVAGSEGVMLLPNYIRPTLYPKAKFQGYEYPDAGEANHYAQFVSACRGEGQTTRGFAYSGPPTESILLGGIASRFPQTTLKWNAKKMKFNLPEAKHFLRREYRKGWSIKGLS